MSGYRNGLNKSTNAVVAETRGFFPVATVAKRLRLPTKFLRIYCDWALTEWHHASKYYTKIDYMNFPEVKLWVKNDPKINEKVGYTFESSISEWRKKQEKKANESTKAKPVYHYSVIVEWIELEGTHKYPTVQKHRDENATAIDNGNCLIDIILSDGTKFKKSKYSRGFKIIKKGKEILTQDKTPPDTKEQNSVVTTTAWIEKILAWYINSFIAKKRLDNGIKQVYYVL